MVFLQIAIGVGLALISAGIQYYRAKQATKALSDTPPPGFDEGRVPVVTESDVIPVLFGTRRLAGPNVLWYDAPLIAKNPGEDFYRTYLDMIMGFCVGPIDKVVSIDVGDVPLINSEIDLASGPSQKILTSDVGDGVTAGNMFGGTSGPGAEGGISGQIVLNPGYPAQGTTEFDRYTAQAGLAYRGLFTVLLRGTLTRTSGSRDIALSRFYHGTTANIKPWAMTCRRVMVRSFGDAQWYSEKALVGDSMNPAHILREVITDQMWGMAKSVDVIDAASFTAAADALFTDDFGISITWAQQTSARDFISEIDRHIDGVTYEDPETGKWKIKLIRDDYDIATLDTLDQSSVISVSGYSRPSWHERVTVLSVIYHDLAAGRDSTVTLHDQAGISVRGEIPQTIQYPGITNGALANKIASRDLRALSAPVASVELVVHHNEVTRALLPGDVFLWDWPDYGVEGMVLRVTSVTRGTPTSGAITLQCSEDVFAWEKVIQGAPTGSIWTEPVVVPTNPGDLEAIELPLWMRASLKGIPTNSAAFINPGGLADSELGTAALIAVQYDAAPIDYDLWTDTADQDPQFVRTVDRWCYQVTPSSDISPETATSIGLADAGLTLSKGDVLYYAETGEMLMVTAFTIGTPNTITVRRGILDTTPAQLIPEDAALFLIGNIQEIAGADDPFRPFMGVDGWDRPTTVATPREIELRALVSTGLRQLTYAEATSNKVEMLYRTKRPYPPGKVAVVQNTGKVDVSWEHRNRVLFPFPLQTDEGMAFPENHIRYLLDIYEEAPMPGLLRQEVLDDVAVKTYEYTDAKESFDRGGGAATRLRFEMRSQRSDGVKTPDIRDLSYYAQIRHIQR